MGPDWQMFLFLCLAEESPSQVKGDEKDLEHSERSSQVQNVLNEIIRRVKEGGSRERAACQELPLCDEWPLSSQRKR